MKKLLLGILGEHNMRDTARKIGSFMIGVGAIIELKETSKILVCKRMSKEVNFGTWEIIYGRINHHEELTTALQREVFEETGIENIRIKKLNRIWHIYRGVRDEETETYGFTFVCETDEKEVKISEEHSAFEWKTPEEVLPMMVVPGIKQDIELYIQNKSKPTSIPLSYINSQIEIL